MTRVSVKAEFDMRIAAALVNHRDELEAAMLDAVRRIDGKRPTLGRHGEAVCTSIYVQTEHRLGGGTAYGRDRTADSVALEGTQPQ